MTQPDSTKGGEYSTSALTLRLRPVAPRDLQTLYEIQTDPEGNEMAGTKPRSREAFFAGWERNFTDPGVNPWVIEIVNARQGGAYEVVGSVSRFQADGHDSVGYWIARPHWGKGIASRALAMFLAQERIRPLFATTNSTNVTSRRILEKCGFRLTGTRAGVETDRYLARTIADFVLE